MSNSIMPLVYIILVNYNGLQDTIECINSIKKIRYQNYKLVVVDNCSSDNSYEQLRDKFPEEIIIQSGNNLGFAGGNNIGINYAIEQGADYVLLLNNDTIVNQDFLNNLVSLSESDKQIGIVGGKIYYWYKPSLIWFAGAKINSFTGRTQHIGDKELDKGQYDQVRETDYITGCMMLVRREAIEMAGLMDEKYFLYYEETDWNIAIKSKGFKIVYTPYSVIYHKVSAATNKTSYSMNYYYDRNVVYFIEKNYSLLNKIFIHLYIRVILLLKFIKAFLKKDIKKKSIVAKTYRSIRNKEMGEYKL